MLHGPTKLEESHGEEVVIVQDPDGHEICFVDAEGNIANSILNPNPDPIPKPEYASLILSRFQKMYRCRQERER